MTGIMVALSGGNPYPGALDVQYVTSARTGGAPGEYYYGYISGVQGSITDGTSNIYGGATILEIYYDQNTGLNYLKIGGVQSNSGWTSMRCTTTGVTLNRSNATFSTSLGNSTWSWSALTYGVFILLGSPAIVFT